MNPAIIKMGGQALQQMTGEVFKGVGVLTEAKTNRISQIRQWAAPLAFLAGSVGFIAIFYGWIGWEWAGVTHDRAVTLINQMGARNFLYFIGTLMFGTVGAITARGFRDTKIEEIKKDKEIEVAKEIVKNDGHKLRGFARAIHETLGHEGGYSNHPSDKGGETYKGIARKMWPSWDGWKVVDKMRKKRKNFPQNLAESEELNDLIEDFYKLHFWDAVKGDDLAKVSDDIAVEVFDTAVNTGIYTAIRCLQRALNMCGHGFGFSLEEDGVIGAKTIEALDLLCPKYEKAVLRSANFEQGLHYHDICTANPDQLVFWRGWMNRLG